MGLPEANKLKSKEKHRMTVQNKTISQGKPSNKEKGALRKADIPPPPASQKPIGKSLMVYVPGRGKGLSKTSH